MLGFDWGWDRNICVSLPANFCFLTFWWKSKLSMALLLDWVWTNLLCHIIADEPRRFGLIISIVSQHGQAFEVEGCKTRFHLGAPFLWAFVDCANRKRFLGICASRCLIKIEVSYRGAIALHVTQVFRLRF